MTKKAIIFDIGGVLAYDVWEHLMLDETSGIASVLNLDTDQVRIVGKVLWNEYAYKNVTKEKDWKQIEVEYWKRFNNKISTPVPTSYFIKLTNDFIRPIEGMIQLLERLKANRIDLAICSDNTEFWSKRQINSLGLDKFFDPDKIVLSSRIGVSKSSENFEMFKAVVSALTANKDECIFVDDRVENVIQALRYGITGVIFPTHSKYGSKYLSMLLKEMGVI
jgi:HAD superfamily hydrolase (TIGR01509 family)